MNMQYQDMQIAKNKIIKMYIKNPNRSISATFRTLKAKTYTSFIGDYPILSTIITSINAISITPSRFQVRHALNQSKELGYLTKKEKTNLLDQLVYPISVQSKILKNHATEKISSKMSNIPFNIN